MRTLALVLSTHLFFAAAAGADSLLYRATRNYAVSDTPQEVRTADLNHDAIPDVVVSTFREIHVFLGTRAGVLRLPVRLGLPSPAAAFAIADFTGDTHPDIATETALIPGRGDGTFDTPVGVPYSCDCQLAAADFDGDGRMDLAVAAMFATSIWFGSGDGGFTQGPDRFPAFLPTSAAASDLNADGHPDLVVADFGARAVAVLLNTGEGRLVRREYTVGTSPFTAVAADFNGDLRPDLAVNDRDSNQIYLFMNIGNGEFGPAATHPAGCTPFVPQGCSLEGLDAFDVNGDGIQDLATPGSVSLGNGDGTFREPHFFAAGNYPRSVAAVRFRPGRAHLVVANEQGRNISVVPVRRPLALKTVPDGDSPRHAIDGDFNRDGRRDLAVASRETNRVMIYLGTGLGSLIAAGELEATSPAALVHEDFNGDRLRDLAASGYYGTWIFLANANGTFRAGVRYPNLPGECTAGAFESIPQRCFVSGDINGDGHVDLVGASWIQNRVLTLLGNGNGTFRDGPSFDIAGPPRDLTLADFNRDGRLDLAIPTFGGGVDVRAGRGDGTFGDGAEYLGSSQLRATAAADLNGDGNVDLVAAGAHGESFPARSVVVLLGAGDGTFGEPLAARTGLEPITIAVTDANRDGLPDIVTANFQSYDVALLAGTGDGGLAPAIFYVAGQAPNHVLLTDLNGDGRPDIVTTDQYSDTLTVSLHLPF